MKEIFDVLKSPVFWFGTVIAGILINVASHHLIKRYEHFLETISTRWANRNKKLKANRDARIKTLAKNPAEQQFLLTLAVNNRVKATYQIVLLVFYSLVLVMWKIELINHADKFGSLEPYISATLKTIFLFVGIFTLWSLFGYIADSIKIEAEISDARKIQGGFNE